MPLRLKQLDKFWLANSWEITITKTVNEWSIEYNLEHIKLSEKCHNNCDIQYWRWKYERIRGWTLVRISLALSAQWRVFWVSPNERLLGLILAIITVLQAPPRESLRSWVSFELRYGMCFLPSTRALIQLLSARSDLFMLAPSRDLSVLWSVARALSDPARSISESLPTRLVTFMAASLTRYSTTTWI